MNTVPGNRFKRMSDGPRKTPGKAALAAGVGSFLEYYDFFIYGTAAALVFGKVFFPDSDPATGTLLSFATYGVGYVARPVGALFLGHFGDRYGRKRIIMFTVTLMGLSTFLVGCLPTYSESGSGRPRYSWSCGYCRASRRRASSRERTRSASSTRQRDGARSSPASRSAARRPASWLRPRSGCRSRPCRIHSS